MIDLADRPGIQNFHPSPTRWPDRLVLSLKYIRPSFRHTYNVDKYYTVTLHVFIARIERDAFNMAFAKRPNFKY